MKDFVVAYKFLSLGLSYPDTKTWTDFQAILGATETVFQDELLKHAKDIRKLVAATSSVEMESEYLRIFDVGGKISPYETEYLTEKISRKPHELADIAGFYQAFSCEVGDERKEASDHIAVELEFLAFLGLKELYAGTRGLTNELGVVRDAKKKFLNEHVLKWGFFYCTQVEKLTDAEFYITLSRSLELVLTAECVANGFDPDSFRREMSRLPYEGIRGDEFACGQTCVEV